MLPCCRFPVSLVLLACCLTPLTACSNSSLGEQLQQSLAADPQLRASQSPISTPTPTVTASPPATGVDLPADFPSEIPRYPNSQLQQVVPSGTASPNANGQPTVTRWTSPDSSDRILGFYRQALQTGNWQVMEQPATSQQGTLVAQRQGLTLTLTVQPIVSLSPGNAAKTEFTLQYGPAGPTVGQGSPVPTATGSPAATGNSGSLTSLPPFQTTTTVGISGTSTGSAPVTSGLTALSFTDLDKLPPDLRSQIEDLARLGVLSASGTKGVGKTNEFAPSQPLTRREYARWLVTANNLLFASRPAQQIRLGQDTSQPAFRDVPPSDPDFAAIQGLAEAGILPSALSGDSTTVLFNPDKPLTRETMVQWKVPLDTRQALPKATVDAVQQTWGFRDAARIDPKALQAVLADHQNGDQANIRRAFGYTALFQPKKPVSRAEAAASLWYFGFQGDGQSAQDALKSQ